MTAISIPAPWGAWKSPRGDMAGKQPGAVIVQAISLHAPWGAWMHPRGNMAGKQPGEIVERVSTQRLWMVNINRFMNQ